MSEFDYLEGVVLRCPILGLQNDHHGGPNHGDGGMDRLLTGQGALACLRILWFRSGFARGNRGTGLPTLRPGSLGEPARKSDGQGQQDGGDSFGVEEFSLIFF